MMKAWQPGLTGPDRHAAQTGKNAVKVQISSERCQGHGRCYDLVPDLFGEDDQGSRGLECSSSASLDHSPLISPPIDGGEYDDLTVSEDEDEDGLVPRPSCSGKCLLPAKQTITTTCPPLY